MQLIVDADACPRSVMQILFRLEKEYPFNLVTVSSFHHEIKSSHHIVAEDSPDGADLVILNRLHPGDIVVTQDWGLASLVLARKAKALSPWGYEYLPERMDFMLHERYIKAKQRRSGKRTKGPAARVKDDDIRFEDRLCQMLQHGSKGQ